MAKQESDLKVVAVLVIIAMFSAILLAYVNKVTRGPIAENKKAEMKSAIKIVLKGIDLQNVREVPLKLQIDNSPVQYFTALSDQDSLLGAALIVKAPNGFSGDFDLMVGVAADGSIIDTYILQHHETPGLGDKMGSEAFKKQFRKKQLETTHWQVRKDGGDIDALTAATITSRAFTKGVKRALLAYKQITK